MSSDSEKTEYVFIWGNTQGILTLEGDMMALVRHKENIWNSLGRMLHVSKDNKISCYLSLPDVNHNIELSKLWLDDEYSVKFFREVSSVCDRHRAMFVKLKNIDYATLSSESLLGAINEIVSQYSETIGYFRGSQMAATQSLVDIVTNVVPPEEVSILLLPAEIDQMNYEQIEWQDLLLKPYDEISLLRHAEKYPWLVAYHLTLEDVKRTLSEKFQNDVNNFVAKDIKKEKELLKKRQDIILVKYPTVKKYVYLLNNIAFSRMELKSCWAGNDFYSIPIFTEIASRSGETAPDVSKYYLLNDLKLLLGGKKLSSEEKQQRKKCVTFLWKNGTVRVKFGEEAEEQEKIELGDLVKVAGIKFLKGYCARAGLVTGVVRLLLSNDIEKSRDLRSSFRIGEILVTEMTQPNVMDIAKKAGAIITDEGGMLSHAAIISREFGIPCIVGTRNATKVLKDGDVVEVNANNGIITIH